MTGKRLTLSEVTRHEELHVRLGHIDESADFIAPPASQLPIHSDMPLYSLILQHSSLYSAKKTQQNESSLGICETEGDSDHEINFEDISDASDCDGEIKEESFSEEEELHEFESGILTKEHRLRILEQNTTIWSVSHSLLIPYLIYI